MYEDSVCHKCSYGVRLNPLLLSCVCRHHANGKLFQQAQRCFVRHDWRYWCEGTWIRMDWTGSDRMGIGSNLNPSFPATPEKILSTGHNCLKYLWMILLRGGGCSEGGFLAQLDAAKTFQFSRQLSLLLQRSGRGKGIAGSLRPSRTDWAESNRLGQSQWWCIPFHCTVECEPIDLFCTVVHCCQNTLQSNALHLRSMTKRKVSSTSDVNLDEGLHFSQYSMHCHLIETRVSTPGALEGRSIFSVIGSQTALQSNLCWLCCILAPAWCPLHMAYCIIAFCNLYVAAATTSKCKLEWIGFVSRA